MRAEALRQQLAALESQRELLQDLVQDASRSLTTLESVAAGKEGDEVLVPIGAGTFLQARLGDVSSAITTIGSGLHAQLPVDQARSRMQGRIEALQDSSKRVSADVARLVQELDGLNAMLESQMQG